MRRLWAAARAGCSPGWRPTVRTRARWRYQAFSTWSGGKADQDNDPARGRFRALSAGGRVPQSRTVACYDHAPPSRGVFRGDLAFGGLVAGPSEPGETGGGEHAASAAWFLLSWSVAGASQASR